MLRPFALHRPASLAETLHLLDTLGDEAALYAGGTELLLVMKEGLLRPAALIDVKRVPGLGDIAAADGVVSIGATARHREVERSALLRARCPLVPGVARHVANVRVRAVGTVGGNLAFADPHSDLATLFLALDATVTLASRAGPREVPLSAFVRGAYETARADGEVLTGVRFRPWPAATGSAYLKFGVFERPTLGVAVALPLDAAGRIAGPRVAVGCVGPRPQRLAGAERLATGETLHGLAGHAGVVADAAAAEVEADGDLHGSAEYKREMARVFVRRALGVAITRARAEESHARYPHTVVVS